jgi:hypothetical protein
MNGSSIMPFVIDVMKKIKHDKERHAGTSR